MKPEFVDNRNGSTLVTALRWHLDRLANAYAQPTSRQACLVAYAYGTELLA